MTDTLAAIAGGIFAVGVATGIVAIASIGIKREEREFERTGRASPPWWRTGRAHKTGGSEGGPDTTHGNRISAAWTAVRAAPCPRKWCGAVLAASPRPGLSPFPGRAWP